jgi:hypothetical protein
VALPYSLVVAPILALELSLTEGGSGALAGIGVEASRAGSVLADSACSAELVAPMAGSALVDSACSAELVARTADSVLADSACSGEVAVLAAVWDYRGDDCIPGDCWVHKADDCKPVDFLEDNTADGSSMDDSANSLRSQVG